MKPINIPVTRREYERIQKEAPTKLEHYEKIFSPEDSRLAVIVSAAHHDQPMQVVATLHECIGCGCTEVNACTSGITNCAWLAVNSETGLGVCTNCPEKCPEFQTRLFHDSPAVGTPECICSLCECPIMEGPAVRVYKKGGHVNPSGETLEERFHHNCAQYAGAL